MLKLSKLGRSFKILVFLRHFYTLFLYHSENFQKYIMCVRFNLVSCLSSEEESLQTRSKRQQ